MQRNTRISPWTLAMSALVTMAVVPPAAGAEKPFVPLEVRQVKLGGEIGRRIDVTIDNNLLRLDLDKDFLKPFREKTSPDGFIGLGMLIDSAVGLAAYSGDEKAIERKKYLDRRGPQDPGARRLPRHVPPGRSAVEAVGHSRNGLHHPRIAAGP